MKLIVAGVVVDEQNLLPRRHHDFYKWKKEKKIDFYSNLLLFQFNYNASQIPSIFPCQYKDFPQDERRKVEMEKDRNP